MNGSSIYNETAIANNNPRSRAIRNWTLIKNLIKASHFLKQPQTEVVKDIGKMIDNIKLFPTKDYLLSTISVTSSAIQNHKIEDLLFQYIKRSNREDLYALKELIDNHPLKYVRSVNDPESFINKPDMFGIRPIYEAVRNGYLETVQILLDSGANPKLKSNGENCLQAASRWGYILIIKCLFSATHWTAKEVKKALKETKNKNIVAYLKERGNIKFMLCGC